MVIQQRIITITLTLAYLQLISLPWSMVLGIDLMFVGIGPYFIGFFDCISKYYLNSKNVKF